MLKIHKPKSENKDITTVRTSSESHLHWKKHFPENPFYFRIYADFEADIEKYNSGVGKKTTNIYKQNPVLIGYEKVIAFLFLRGTAQPNLLKLSIITKTNLYPLLFSGP